MSDIEFREIRWRCLVADDSPIAAAAVRNAIERFHIRSDVHEVRTGAECLEALATNSFDVAFVDLHFPDLSGLAAIEAARSLGTRTFVTVVSSLADETNLAMAKALKAYDFLRKPFAFEDVARVLETYAQASRQRRLLLVDDSGTARRLMARLVSRSIFRFDVVEAPDAVSGFETFVATKPDVVLIDLNLGAIDGRSAYRIFRAHRPSAFLALVSADADGLAKSGVTRVLRKPFHEADLDLLLHDFLALKRPYAA